MVLLSALTSCGRFICTAVGRLFGLTSEEHQVVDEDTTVLIDNGTRQNAPNTPTTSTNRNTSSYGSIFNSPSSTTTTDPRLLSTRPNGPPYSYSLYPHHPNTRPVTDISRLIHKPVTSFPASTIRPTVQPSTLAIRRQVLPAPPIKPLPPPTISTTNLSEPDHFLFVLLNLSLTTLNEDYTESSLTEHLQRFKYYINSQQPLSNQLPLSYDSHDHYKSSYLPLILYDTWASIVANYHDLKQAIGSISLKVTETRITTEWIHLTLGSSVLVKDLVKYNERYSLESWLVLVRVPSAQNIPSVEIADTPEKRPQFSQNSSKTIALGYVTFYQNDLYIYGSKTSSRIDSLIACGSSAILEYILRIAQTVDSDHFLKQLGKQQVILEPIAYLRPTIRQVETLEQMSSRAGFTETFLNPKPAVCSLNFRPPFALPPRTLERFNEHQANAITACVNAVTQTSTGINKTVMIQGPPGTGKTHTLVGIINCLLRSIPDIRILICAPSNGAIDEIARRLLALEDSSLTIVRLGMSTKVHEDVQLRLLSNLVDEKWIAQGGGGKGKRSRKMIREGELGRANVILSTLNSVQSSSMEIFRGKQTFDCIIVDEASQCTEPEVLMPLVYPTSKLILIGDHKQLPATVISRIALKGGFGRSMFERLFLHLEKIDSSSSQLPTHVSLIRQFRMHKAIVAFPSKHFYEARLETPPGTGENDRICLKPYTVFDIAYARESMTDSSVAKISRLNVEEGEFIVKLILGVLEKLGYQKRQPWPEKFDATIGVITFYNGQKDELSRRLRACGLLEHIKVDTVDAFQGQERDIIILSCVRAFEGSGDVGFVRSKQRMNVALTRAKSALYVCINAKSFKKIPKWKELLADGRTRGDFVHMSRTISNERLLKWITPEEVEDSGVIF